MNTDLPYCTTINPERILIITSEYGRKISGGAGRVVNAITQKLCSQIAVDVLHLTTPVPIMGMIAAELHRLSPGQSNNTTFRGSVSHVLGKVLDNNSYKAVHLTHNGISSRECIRFIKTKYPEQKCIFSCHSIARYENGIRKPWKSHIRCEEYVMQHVDRIHLLNNASFAFLKTSYETRKFNLPPISIIANGIEDKGFREINLQWKALLEQKLDSENNVIVLCMSRWCHGKGLEYLLEAADLVSRKTKNIRFVLAGRKLLSWEKSALTYTRMIDRRIRKLRNLVFPLGWLNDIQRNTIFSMAHIWVMPSELEYFPYSILQPMMNRIPIISSDIAPVKELLIENNECLFYNPRQSSELAGQIIRLAGNKQLRESLAQNAYCKAITELGWDRIAQRYLDMYRSV